MNQKLIFGIALVAPMLSHAISIRDAKLLPANSVVHIDPVVVVNIADTVNSTSFKNFQVRDLYNGLPWENQECATVFGNNAEIDAILTGVSVGDVIELDCATLTFNGLFELGSITGVVAMTRTAYTPGGPIDEVNILASDLVDGNPAGELRESQLVRMNNVTFTTTGNFIYGNHMVTDGTNTITVRVPVNTMNPIGTPIPTGPVDLTGVVGQFDSVGPFDGGYQLYIRSLSDVTVLTRPKASLMLNLQLPEWQYAYGSTPTEDVVAVDFINGGGVIETTNAQFSASTGVLSVNVPVSVTGDYGLHVKFGPWLGITTPILPFGNQHFGTFSALTGDIDGDDEVGPGDFAELSQAFGSALGDDTFNENADFDADFEIGPGDFATLSANFGESGE